MRTTFSLNKKYLILGMLSISPVLAFAAPQPSPWASMTRSDADFISDWVRRESISAVYPAKDVFATRLKEARQVLDQNSTRVDSYQGYRQALNQFVGSFQDQHLFLSFSLTPSSYQWPGFFAVYRDQRYFTAGSQGNVADGQEVTECDNLPMTQWASSVATYEQMIVGLESSKAKAAPLIFRDVGSPFIPRPKHCIIGGKDVALEWRDIASGKFSADVNAVDIVRDNVTAITPFGANGAWVRMGIFAPGTQEEGKSFQRLFAGAPGLRDKSVVVLDVRGNGGGPYEWFMGFLRALYGNDYTNYHARARLQISAVYRITPEILTYFNETDAAETDALAPPPDGVPFDPHNTELASGLKAGKALLVAPKNAPRVPMPRQAPANPVKAKVYVLTDYRCGSACIGFVDELKRFPGVEQIGVDTHVDSRTGTPFSAPLPSGIGRIYVPVMTRDGRERDDNVPQRPSHVFTGNIADTAAVKAWIQSEVLTNK